MPVSLRKRLAGREDEARFFYTKYNEFRAMREMDVDNVEAFDKWYNEEVVTCEEDKQSLRLPEVNIPDDKNGLTYLFDKLSEYLVSLKQKYDKVQAENHMLRQEINEIKSRDEKLMDRGITKILTAIER